MPSAKSFKRRLPILLLLAFLSAGPLAPAPAWAGSGSAPTVAILVNGFGDCCAQRMVALINALRGLGVKFPTVSIRKLDGKMYIHHVTPWNSFTGLDQGFLVNLDPQFYVQKAMTDSLSQPGSLLDKLGNASDLTTNDDLMEKIMSMVRKGSDAQFLEEVSDYLNKLDPEIQVILIGHSFGADSIMSVLERLNNDILFVAALDTVGALGQRRTNTSVTVPSKVGYFYSRWQENEMFPFDYLVGGKFKDCQARLGCNQNVQNAARAKDGKNLGKKLTHVELPYDPFIQQEMIGIISQLLKGETPAVPTAAAPAPKEEAKKEAKKEEGMASKLLKSFPGKGLFGD